MTICIDKVYLEKFWVGLIDGDGSLQVNHWNRKYLQFRAVIKLKNTVDNENLLLQMKSVVRGTVRKDVKQGCVIWVCDHKNNMKHLLNIWERFPPLTRRMQCQLRFVKECMNHMNVEMYFTQRPLKYKNPFNIILNPLPNYFNSWLSGFIEAEGCFCVRKDGRRSFSISQKNEPELLYNILDYFHATHITIQKKKHEIFMVEFSKKENLDHIHRHLLKNPLLGEKLRSYLQTFPEI